MKIVGMNTNRWYLKVRANIKKIRAIIGFKASIIKKVIAMHIFIRAFLIVILTLGQVFYPILGQLPFAQAQTASLLPNAKQQFFDANGNPLSSGTVTTYTPGTTTSKTTWQDADRTVTNTNPIQLDAAGSAIIYGYGNYRQIVKDSSGNTIWDQVTTSYIAPNSASSTGDGNPVGFVMPWTGITAPNQYLFAYGQEVSRTTYAELYSTIVLTTNVTCTASSATLSNVTDTSQIPIGAAIEASCVPSGATVTAKTTNTITSSANATVTTAVQAKLFPYGNGNGSTTFNLPDLRGRVMAGRDNMGGTAASRLTSTYFTNADAVGAVGGSQSYTQLIANMPSHTHTMTTLSATVTAIQYGSGVNFTGVTAGSGPTGVLMQSSNNTVIPVSFTSATIQNTGNGTAHTIVQPTITVNYVIKVSPDTSNLIATGVMQLGGMTGSIACGAGLTCSGNTIDTVGNAGVVGPGSIGQIPYYTATGVSVFGNPNLNVSNGTLTLGQVGSVIGQTVYAGSTSGSVTVTPQAVAGSSTITWGTQSGTVVVSASSPLVVNNTTGSITCTTCVTSSGGGAITGTSPINVSAAGVVSITGAALTKTDDTNVTLTLGGSASSALVNAASITVGWTGTLGMSRGGAGAALTASNGGIAYSNASSLAILAGTATASLPLLSGASTTPSWATISYPTSANSGGIPYFSSATAIASSAALGAGQIVIGGGAGAAPTTLSCATTTTVLHGGATPSCSQIVNGDITTNTLTNATLAQMPAVTLKGNPTNATANATDFTISSLTQSVAPDATNDMLVIWDSVAGTLKKINPNTIASASVAGVASIAGNTGAFTLTQPITNETNAIVLNATIKPQGRLTLTSATPVLTATVSGATTVYYTPYQGNLVPLYNGTNFIPTAFAETSQATTDATKSPAAVAASSCYDMFAWSDAGTNRVTRGPAWTNITTRSAGTALTLVNGIYLNSVAITNGPAASRGTYVGTICSNASSTVDFIFGGAAASGTASVLNVWNAYNRVLVGTTVRDTTASWAYRTTTWRPANNSTANRITFVQGLSEDTAECMYLAQTDEWQLVGGSAGCSIDSTTAAPSGAVGHSRVQGGAASRYVGLPGIGQHYFQAMEYGSADTSGNWLGASATGAAMALIGRILM